MSVLFLSTYEHEGGAAIAARRLMTALNNNGADASMLCRKNITWGPARLRKQSWSSIAERGAVWMQQGFSSKDIWAIDPALTGQNVTRTEAFKRADVVHLHWVNQGFLSLKTIEKIVNSGKRIVWTMHDEWPLDGLRHYYPTKERTRSDLQLIARKREAYGEGRITFVACSKWLRDLSLTKPLAAGQRIVTIPNAIDTRLFHPMEHTNKRRVLFVAQNVNDERKGIRYLNEACSQLNNTEVIALGRDIPYIKDAAEMARLYASVDCFVTPSLQDNLPNTIMEALACGTPCVGFNVGGIPEMISHKENGYVARYQDASDLAQGIDYALRHRDRLATAAREKAVREYSEEAVARRYLDLYNEKDS